MTTFTYDCQNKDTIYETYWKGLIGDATHITFVNAENVTKVGSWFLFRGDSLTSIDLSPLSNVTHVSDYFLLGCESLTSVDLSLFINVTHVGARFLSWCESLKAIDLSPLTNVTEIGDWFLSECTSLTSIDLSPLSNVTKVGDWFLSDCNSLKSADLSPLSNVTKVGEHFLERCMSLTSIDLSPLEKNIPDIKARCEHLKYVIKKNGTAKKYPLSINDGFGYIHACDDMNKIGFMGFVLGHIQWLKDREMEGYTDLILPRHVIVDTPINHIASRILHLDKWEKDFLEGTLKISIKKLIEELEKTENKQWPWTSIL